MSLDASGQPSRHATGALQQLGTVTATELPRLLRGRRLLWLAGIQLAPVLAAVLFIQWLSLDGLHVYSAVVEWAIFPFFIPLIALFYGGPLLVDEIEQETLPYLTLRPIPKWVLYFGKWLSGTLLAIGLAVAPIFLLYAVTSVVGPGSGPAIDTVLNTVLASGLATTAYVAVFAALGVWTGKSVIGGLIYFALFDVFLGQIPVFKLVTIRYHVFNIGGFEQPAGAQVLDALLNAGSFSASWGVSIAVAAAWTVVMVAAGAALFSSRQYQI